MILPPKMTPEISKKLSKQLKLESIAMVVVCSLLATFIILYTCSGI